MRKKYLVGLARGERRRGTERVGSCGENRRSHHLQQKMISDRKDFRYESVAESVTLTVKNCSDLSVEEAY